MPDGLGTALKPACEPIVLARKPLSEKTVAANVLKHGTGALNVDACRVETDENRARMNNARTAGTSYVVQREARFIDPGGSGRWPANVVHDGSDEVVAAFPDGRGQAGPEIRNRKTPKTTGIYGAFGEPSRDGIPHDTPGSAARFFYQAKADAADRLGSKHPTVKPVDLMAWLVKLITPPGGTVLDPFAGSGSTGMACLREGFDCILIEREAQYIADIRRRLKHVKGEDAPLFSGDAA